MHLQPRAGRGLATDVADSPDTKIGRQEESEEEAEYRGAR